MAMIATFHFIRRSEFGETLRIAQILLNDGHDLIHKAVGWMLREVGKRDLTAETSFLDRYASTMPRTALRYAVERFPRGLRRRYMDAAKVAHYEEDEAGKKRAGHPGVAGSS